MDTDKCQAIAASWDGGEMGCGGFIVELRRVLEKLQPGKLAHVCAHGSGAVADIPAWCGMTGHLLVLANHPNYIIQKKGD